MKKTFLIALCASTMLCSFPIAGMAEDEVPEITAEEDSYAEVYEEVDPSIGSFESEDDELLKINGYELGGTEESEESVEFAPGSYEAANEDLSDGMDYTEGGEEDEASFVEVGWEEEALVGDVPEGLLVDENSFPDEAFRGIVLQKFDKDGNGYLSDSELADVTGLNVKYSEVKSLAGIEYFPNLNSMYCGNNAYLTAVDLSRNPNLENVSIMDNASLNRLDVSGNPELEILNLDRNGLEELILGTQKNLQMLTAATNRLKSLDVSQCPELETLTCQQNELTELDLSGNPDLEFLACGTNHLKKLDLRMNTALRSLNCQNNELTRLDFTGLEALKNVYCYSNKLQTLTINEKAALERLDCSNNELTTLDVSKYVSLVELICFGNKLTALLPSASLEILDCSDNDLTTLNMKECPKMKELTTDGNHDLTLDITGNALLLEAYHGSKTLGTAKLIYSSNKAYFTISERATLVTGEKPEKTDKPAQQNPPAPTSIKNAVVTCSPVTYTGSPIIPALTVKLNNVTLKEGTDYTVQYQNNVNAGKAAIYLTGIGKYSGKKSCGLIIAKAAQPMIVKAKTPSVKAVKVAKKDRKIAKSKAFKITKAKGKVQFKKTKGNKKIIVGKNGEFTIKKGLGKGSYKVKVLVAALGDMNYKAGSKTVTVTVIVK